MNLHIFRKLYGEGLISANSFGKVRTVEENRHFSVHWELKALLYIGVLLLSGGLGILIYKNIDTIGHQAILAFIAAIGGGCFYYCYKRKAPFSFGKVESPDALFDYLLLLACLTLVSFIAYIQYQYAIFGDHLKLASFVPMVILFFCAYYFDHLGVLSIGITNLAAWMGIVVTPTKILKQNDFHSDILIYTGMLLGALLLIAGGISRWKQIKPHFRFTYINFGAHILFIACLAGLFHFQDEYLLWFLLLLGIAYYFYRLALRDRSFYFLVILTLYTYIGLAYVAGVLLFDMNSGMTSIYLGLIFYIGSAVGMIRFLIHHNKKFKAHDSI
jgi:hypothetical protein